MWKDTFFAILFLAALTMLFDIIMTLQSGAKVSKKTYFGFGIVVFLTSLARNSGWSSLLVLSIFLLFFSIQNKEKFLTRLSYVIISSVLSALITIAVIYPAVGVVNSKNIVVGLSIPLQQVSRVITYDGEITDFEMQQIDSLIDIDLIPEIYNEEISDPIKANTNPIVLEDNLKEYTVLWINLGLKNPKIYLDAYLRLTQNFWAIDSDSTISNWTWDCRIFDNPYGVIRIPKLYPNFDPVDLFHKILNATHSRFLLYSSLVLWVSIFLIGLSNVRKNKLGTVLFTPILALYIGLMFTAPVSLFRYTYGAYVCAPLLFCFAFFTPPHESHTDTSHS